MTPQKIDRYEIKSEVGRGGMASVYEAYDPRFERTVAIKVLPREFMHDPEFRARFTREAKVIAGLEHPAIVPVYDFGEDDSQPYLVMRLMRGGSLSDRLAEGPISIEETAVILKRLGSALDRAHEQGIVHRDMKPSNVLFDEYGDAYLADFGIVRVASSGDNALTASGSLIGTPAYMSPEQVYGDKELDGRSDIYALGVILFQMLTGVAPYEADTPARMMMKHVMDPVPQIHQVRPDLPNEFEGIINKAMAKERRERFPNAGELSSALTKVTRQTEKDAVMAELAAVKSELEADADEDTATVAPLLIETDDGQETASTLLLAQVVSDPQTEPMTVSTDPDKTPTYAYSATETTNNKVGIPAWIWGVVGVLLFACVAGVAGIIYLVQQQDFASFGAEDTPVAIAVEDVATEDASSEATETLLPVVDVDNEGSDSTRASLAETRAASFDSETPTAAANGSDQIDADATRDSLAETRAASSSDAATVTPAASDQTGSEATRASLVETRTANNVTTITPPQFAALFGPDEGAFTHALDNIIKSAYADVDLQDFYAQAVFNNPFGSDVANWDFGLTFRQVDLNEELRLVIRANGSWNLNARSEEDDLFLAEGEIPDLLNTSEGDSNRLEVIVLGEVGYFFVNGRYADTFTLPDTLNSGDIAIGTGFYSSGMQEGATTSYSSYAVWPLDTLFGPQNGVLDHLDDDLIKQEYAEGETADFIMRATFTNPHQADDETGWDYGFVFRNTRSNDQYWLILTSDEDWTLDHQTEEDDFFLQEGELDNLNTAVNETNELVLIAQNETGYFFVNGQFIDRLDLSDLVEAGETAVVAAFFLGNERIGTQTNYANFTIWSLP